MDEDRIQKVRDRAHALWERAGRPQGQDMEHWSQAERELAEEGDAQSPAGKVVGRRERKPKKAEEGAAEAPKAKPKRKAKVVAEGSDAAK